MTSSDALQTIGRTIRRNRESLGLSRADFAGRCDLSASTVKNAEYGNDLRLETLIRLADGLGLSLRELIGEADVHEPASSIHLRALGGQVGELDEDEQDLVQAFIRVLAKWSARMDLVPAM